MPHLALTLATEISFGELLAALLFVGGLERLIYRLPARVVGPGGWLLDTRLNTGLDTRPTRSA